jgi:hypothetical protein
MLFFDYGIYINRFGVCLIILFISIVVIFKNKVGFIKNGKIIVGIIEDFKIVEDINSSNLYYPIIKYEYKNEIYRMIGPEYFINSFKQNDSVFVIHNLKTKEARIYKTKEKDYFWFSANQIAFLFVFYSGTFIFIYKFLNRTDRIGFLLKNPFIRIVNIKELG